MLTTEGVFNFLKKYRKWIVFFWIAATIFCSFNAMTLMNVTVFSLLPPNGSSSRLAYNKMQQYFSNFLFTDTEIIVIEMLNNDENINNNITQRLCNHLNQSLYNLNNPILDSVEYYYQYTAQNISQQVLTNVIEPKFIDSSGNIMIFLITANMDGVSTERFNRFLDSTQSILADITSNITYSNSYNLELTGMMTLVEECMQIITKDVSSKDMIMIPIIFIFMLYIIGSYKLVLLPFICFGMVVSISFTIYGYLGKINLITVPPEAPPFMLFITMAICVDYGMFLLTRFINGIQMKQLLIEEAIKDMLRYSGHVIVLSGTILVLLEVGFGLFLRCGGLDIASYGIALCVFLSIIISISFTTSTILLFPNFFGDIERIPKICKKCCNSKRIADNIDNEELMINTNIDNDKNKKDINFYFKLGQFVTRMPYKILCPLFIYLLMSPVLYQLLSWRISMAYTMYFPTNTDSVTAYNKIIDNFSPGLMQPIYVLAVPQNHEKNTIWNQAYFDDLCVFGNALIENQYVNNSDITSFSFFSDPMNKQNIECIKNESHLHSMIENKNEYIHNIYFDLYLEIFNMTVNEEENASLIVLNPTFNPFDDTAEEHANNLRDFVTSFGQQHESMDVYVHSALFWQIDLMEVSYNRMPYCLSVMLSLIFIIIGIVFKSILLPFRLLLCIVIPIMFVYGCCIGIYGEGWLNWTNFNGYQGLSYSDGFYFATPVLSLALLLGLALDYEIFLYSRVYEYRSKHGYTTRASIILALSRTGPVISAAGTVMAMAFAGLLFESIVSCDQFGLIFVLGVIIDTFIVRPILVPSILSFADYWNWYPSIMPSKNLKNEYHQIVYNKHDDDDDEEKNDKYINNQHKITISKSQYYPNPNSSQFRTDSFSVDKPINQ